MGISQRQEAGAVRSYIVDKWTVTASKGGNFTADCQSIAKYLAPSNIYKPINENYYPSPSLDENILRSIEPAPKLIFQVFPLMLQLK